MHDHGIGTESILVLGVELIKQVLFDEGLEELNHKYSDMGCDEKKGE